MFRPVIRTRPRRRGAAVVEMAVITPVLLMFIFGIIEFGRFIMIGQMSVNATREGDRYAVQADSTPTQVKAVAKQYLAGAGVPDTAISTLVLEQQLAGTWVAITDDDMALKSIPAGTAVRLRMQIDYDKVTWLPRGLFIAQTSKISSATVMRKE
ncbi:MAG TPA: TadE/TadG family type IV pilus assembly protein [Fimbriiglobus sp.]|nr:TadE/TadG family type IV pilus assembly protein [Fimbriiglobus sp.]